jgi:hypothetical protein
MTPSSEPPSPTPVPPTSTPAPPTATATAVPPIFDTRAAADRDQPACAGVANRRDKLCHGGYGIHVGSRCDIRRGGVSQPAQGNERVVFAGVHHGCRPKHCPVLVPKTVDSSGNVSLDVDNWVQHPPRYGLTISELWRSAKSCSDWLASGLSDSRGQSGALATLWGAYSAYAAPRKRLVPFLW